MNDDFHARIQLLILPHIDIGGDALAEQPLDLEPDFLFDGEISQGRLENLADGCDRQAVENDDTLRLGRRLHDVAFEMLLDRLQIDCVPRPGDNEQDRHLSGVLIRHADGRADLHARKFIGDVFDRRRIDIVSATDDQVLGAAGQDQPLVFGEIADVAGHQPAIVRQNVDVVQRIDVAGKHLRPANDDQAARELGTLLHLLRALQGDDPGHCIRRPEADAARKRFAATGIESDGSRRFGHAIRFEQSDAGALLKPLADCLRQDRAAGQRHAN